MRKSESAVSIHSEVIKGSSEGPFWEQKIKMVLLSHLPQSQSHLMWPLQAARPGANIFSAADHKTKYAYSNMF